MPTRSALCISPPSTIWKSPFNRLFSRSEGRSSGSDDFDPAGPRSVSLGGGPGPERLAAIRGAPGRGLHRPFPPPAAAAGACRAQDGGSGVPSAHGDARARRRPRRPAPSVDSSRPKLVLLRPTDDAAAADVDDSDGGHYERVGVLDRPEPACVPEVSADLSAFRREQARRRCTMLLRCLCGVAISTGLIGMLAGDAPRLGLHRPLRAGRPRPGRTHGLRQGARGGAAPPPARGPGTRPVGGGATSIRRRPAIPVPGTTTTTSRSPGSQHADWQRPAPDAAGAAPGGPRSPTILGVAGGVAQLAERYVRNVEAVGSNPITSTRKPRSAGWGYRSRPFDEASVAD